MEEPNIKQVLNAINVLIKPSTQGKSKDLSEALRINIQEISSLNPSLVDELSHLRNIHINNSDDICWKYVCICLNVLLLLKKHLQNDENELLSISQQKSVQNIFEFIISIGLLPYLLPGVGLGIEQRCPNASLFKNCIYTSSVSDIDYYRMSGVTKCTLSLIEEKSISSLLLSKNIGDILAALCQLTMPPFKKPTAELISDREYFQTKLIFLVSTSYQPLVINALMLMQGNKQLSPRWLRVGVSKLLSQRLMEKDGVVSTVRAIQHTANCEDPNVVTKLESVARLITTPHTRDAILYYNKIAPQILGFVGSSDVSLIQIGVLCCRVLHEKDKSTCEKYLLSVLMEPLLNCSPCFTEQEFANCIQNLQKCFAIPGGEMWAVPIEPLCILSKIIYILYCKICDSVSVIKKPIEDLLWVILSKTDDKWLRRVFKSLLLNEPVTEIKELPQEICFVFGDEGGIKISADNSDIINSVEHIYSKCILKLFEEKDITGAISKKLFLFFLNYSTSLGDEFSEMKLYITEMLAELAESEKVQKNIASESQSIIDFVDVLITNKLESANDDSEILCIALLLLITIMNDMHSLNKSDWGKLKKLSTSLPKLIKKTKSIELKMLCDEVYNMILTHGVIKSEMSTTKHKSDYSEDNKSGNVKSRCELALNEACDPLLPVRGHAMLELAKLITSGDPEAKAKKDVILCIFQENLKNEDSYLYLSAIEGISSLAAEFPDTVLVTLIEEYSQTETTTRLKVGEALMRVVRRLGDMIPVYKNELLNSFLSGVRDSDNLVRASSLSNVGELCQLLSFRIGPIAAEIFNCVERIVATDPAPEPRRAAVMLLTLVLRGLQSEALRVLEPVLLQLYRTLKKIYLTDKDDVVKLHSQLALEELSKSTLSILFPPENLSKRIYVLDPPP
ncbi:transport and golgi organization 6 isoform X3 [Lycorma delicatula]|uniref:transport and golgi organization 6 isoform X3 n=1 Tax=Lycorma delicatula TaxID=130591 RepID=UPI003F51231D